MGSSSFIEGSQLALLQRMGFTFVDPGEQFSKPEGLTKRAALKPLEIFALQAAQVGTNDRLVRRQDLAAFLLLGDE